MKTHARVTAATVVGLGVVVLGVTTACQRSTEGVVAQTTQPGPPLSSAPTTSDRSPNFPSIPGLPDITIPNLPLPTRGTDVPTVPAPPNSMEMSCSEYSSLDEATRFAVVREILSQENNPLGPQGDTVGQVLADAACQFLPEANVSDVLLGGG